PDPTPPPPELMDTVRAHNQAAATTGAPPIQVATLPTYLSRVAVPGVRDSAPRTGRPEGEGPAVTGELRSHARGNLLPGVFSIRTNLKSAMSREELTINQAERLAALYSAEDHRSFFDL